MVEPLDLRGRTPIAAPAQARYRRFRSLGPYTEHTTAPVPPPERPGIGDRLRNLFDPGRWPAATGRDEPPARDEV